MNPNDYESLRKNADVFKADNDGLYFFELPELSGLIEFRYSHQSESNSNMLADNDFLRVQFHHDISDIVNDKPELLHRIALNDLQILVNYESADYAALIKIKTDPETQGMQVSADEAEQRIDGLLPQQVVI